MCTILFKFLRILIKPKRTQELIFWPSYYILWDMTIQEIYELGVEMGIKSDPRGVEKVKKILEKLKKEHKEMPQKKKKFFDPENLSNPYSDSRILYGDPKKSVKSVLAGIDADASEVLLTDRLREKGRKIDLLISHHPSGHALASLHEVLDIQTATFAQEGVPITLAHGLIEERAGIVRRRISPANHNQAVDAARLLDVPLLALHTIWDNLGDQFLRSYVSKKTFDTAGELLEYIQEIPEFAESAKGKAAPFLASGSPSSPTGRIAVNFTGGTNPSKELYIEKAKAGVSTFVDMHVPEDALVELRKMHANVIDCGHMAADSIGANLYLDELEKRGVEVIPCSGLIRVKRSK